MKVRSASKSRLDCYRLLEMENSIRSLVARPARRYRMTCAKLWTGAGLSLNFFAALLLPPFNMLVIGAIGFWQLKMRPRLGRGLMAGSLFGLGWLSTPYVSSCLLATLQVPPLSPFDDDVDAIVILGGGIQLSAPEYGGGATIKARTLERLRYGASLCRKTGKPILVTGGAPEGYPAEGPIMRSILENEFGVSVRWVESRSRNT